MFNTVFNTTKNLVGEFIPRNFGNLLPSEKVAVDTTPNESSRVPKGKRRNVGKSMAFNRIKNRFNELLRYAGYPLLPLKPSRQVNYPTLPNVPKA